MITWVASYPRSGNTMLRVVLRYGLGLPSPTRYERPAHIERRTGDTPPLQLAGADAPATLEAMQRSDRMWFVKTHELPDDDRPALYLVRDGRDSVVSYARFILDTLPPDTAPPTYRRVLWDLILRDHAYGGWSQHVTTWTRRTGPTAVLRFEDLVKAKDARRLVMERLRALGVAAETQDGHVPDFDSLKRIQPRNFRRGRVGGWRDDMSWSAARVFWFRHGHVMRRMGYSA